MTPQTAPGGSADGARGRARLGDRIAGGILLALSVWYFFQAGSYTVAFGDPAGPALFPRAVSAPTALLALVLILRPDQDPVWFRWPHVLAQIATLGVLVVYPLLIEPIGFPLATTLGALLLSRILGGSWLASVIGGIAMGFGLFVLFDLFFGLPLPEGPIFG